MQAVTIVIKGEYYDSQIYSGRLYLWTNDSGIITIDWNRLVEDLIESRNIEIAMHCAFINSDYLYGSTWQLFSQDRDIKQVVRGKFETISGRRFVVNNLERYILRGSGNKFSFPHASSEIYYGKVLISSSNGLENSTIHDIDRVLQVTDLPCTSASPNNFLLALSSGEEGLYEINPLREIEKTDKIRDFEYKSSQLKQISSKKSNSSDWMYNSIFSCSNEGDIEISKYDLMPRGKNATEQDKIEFYKERPILDTSSEFENIIRKDGNFAPPVIWGVKDKICVLEGGALTAYKYLPWMPKSGQLEFIQNFTMPYSLGDNVSGNSTNFGYIVERDEGLIVLQSNNEVDILPEEPTNWRCFNRSKNYTNQLHAIYEDRIEIRSYNDDYFIDDFHKVIGLSHENSIKDTKSYRQIH